MKRNTVQEIFDLLDRVWVNNVWIEDGFAYVDVDGDWKHDHLRCDYLMSENGFTKIAEQETRTDGSDSYGSIHIYR